MRLSTVLSHHMHRNWMGKSEVARHWLQINWLILTKFHILMLNFEFSIKLNSIWMKFCTRGLLKSLITNPNSKFRNSIWRIQMTDQNAKSYLTWEKFCIRRFLRFTRAIPPPPPPSAVYRRHFTPHMGSTFSDGSAGCSCHCKTTANDLDIK